MPVLIKFEDNYADEFDVYGLRVFKTYEEWQKIFVDFIERNKDNDYIDWYFGSNEFIVIENAKHWIVEQFEVLYISETEYMFLIDHFDKFGYGWGHFPWLEEMGDFEDDS